MKKLLLIILFFICSCGNKYVNETIYSDYLNLENKYPHDQNSFTQGLFFYNNELYETTGLYGNSKIFKNINLETGTYELEEKIANNYFGEGSVIFDNKLYVLTWKEREILIYDFNKLELIEKKNYKRQGWGLTTDGEFLIASDGSSTIYFMDKDLNDIKQIDVTLNNKKINNINELEYIDGYIWANVWQSTYIIIINPKNGKVIKMLDFSSLIPNNLKSSDAVLNGVAYNNERIYITGKNWPYLFEFTIKD